MTVKKVSISILKEYKNKRVEVIERITEEIKARLEIFSDLELKEMNEKLTQLLELLANSESNVRLLNEILKTLWVKQ